MQFVAMLSSTQLNSADVFIRNHAPRCHLNQPSVPIARHQSYLQLFLGFLQSTLASRLLSFRIDSRCERILESQSNQVHNQNLSSQKDTRSLAKQDSRSQEAHRRAII